MLYKLRKLIAFVFLGGMFYLVYRDPSEIENPALMNALGLSALAFGLFWFFVPMIVVRQRIRRRVAQNRRLYEEWKRAGGIIPSFTRLPPRIEWEAGESVHHREKGTLYLAPGIGFDDVSVRGVPSDVAFPALGGNNRKIQRTHFYLTSKRIIFAGKSIFESIPFADIESAAALPGGVDFSVRRDGKTVHMAFTLQNPLIFVDIFASVAGRAS